MSGFLVILRARPARILRYVPIEFQDDGPFFAQLKELKPAKSMYESPGKYAAFGTFGLHRNLTLFAPTPPGPLKMFQTCCQPATNSAGVFVPWPLPHGNHVPSIS